MLLLIHDEYTPNIAQFEQNNQFDDSLAFYNC